MNKEILQEAIDTLEILRESVRGNRELLNAYRKIECFLDSLTVTTITWNSKGERTVNGVVQAADDDIRMVLIQSLVSSKGWMQSYATAYVGDYIDKVQSTKCNYND